MVNKVLHRRRKILSISGGGVRIYLGSQVGWVGGGGRLFAGCKLMEAHPQAVPNNYISHIEN